MHSKLLFRFLRNTSYQEIPRAWQWFRDQKMLALIYCSDNKQMLPYSSILTLVLVDIQTLTIHTSISWKCSDAVIEMLQVVCAPSMTRWVVASLELKNDMPSYHFIVRSFVFDDMYRNISVDVLFDIPAEDMAAIGPIYAAFVKQEDYTIIYRKPASNFMNDSLVYSDQFNLLNKRIKSNRMTGADSALAYVADDRVLLLTLNPGKDVGWEFRLNCFNSPLFDRLWQVNFGPYLSKVPTFPLTGNSDLEWLGANATMMQVWVPQDSDCPAWALGATMVDISLLSGYGHSSAEASSFSERISILVLLDADGRELWRCNEDVGLRLQLCQVDNLIVGVDLLNKQWRLWVWHPQQEAALQNVIHLDREVFRIHVLTDKGTNSKNFWLIEEFKGGVRVSRKDPLFLRETLSVVWLPDVHLLEPQRALGSLNWYEEIDAWVEESTLLLLCIDEEQQLVLYQVE